MLLVGFLLSWILGLLALIPFIGIVFDIIKIVALAALALVALFFIVLQGSFAARGRAVDLPYVGFIKLINYKDF